MRRVQIFYYHNILKRIAAIFFCLMFFAASVSCGINTTELKERIIVECIGIDYNEESSEYMLSVQVFNTNPMGIKGGEAPKEVTKIYESTGLSIAQAMNKITKRLGSEIMNSHNRLVIFGKSAAERGVVEAMDYFIRDYTSRALVQLAVAENSAKELVSANFGKDVLGAKLLDELLSRGAKYSSIPSIYMYEAVNRINDETADFYAPIIKLKSVESGEGEEFIAQTEATAIFKDDKMVGIFNEAETEGLMWVNGIMEKGSIILAPEENVRFSLDIISAKTKYKLSQKEGKPVIDLKFYCSCDIIEYMDKDFSNIDSQALELAKREAERQILEFARAAINRATGEFGADIFRFGNRIKLFKPKLFREIEDDWENIFKDIEVNLYSQVTIRLVGQEAVGFLGAANK